MSTQELIERAQFGFMETRKELSAMAKVIAAKRNWDKDGYRDVIAARKRKQLDADEILSPLRRLTVGCQVLRRTYSWNQSLESGHHFLQQLTKLQNVMAPGD